jgi:hypothetical protein
MQDKLQISTEIFNIMVSFSDGVSNHQHDNAIGALLALWFFLFATVLCVKRLINNGPTFNLTLILISCIFGICRNGFLFIIDYGYFRGFFPHPGVYNSIPLIDHTFQLLGLLAMNYAIIYLSAPPRWCIKYYHFSFIVPFFLYVLIQVLQRFGNLNLIEYSFFIGDIVYHGTMIFMTLSVLALILYRHKSVATSLLCYIMFILTSNAYTFSNSITKSVYSDILIPYHNAYYLWAIPFIIYYIQSIPIQNVTRDEI